MTSSSRDRIMVTYTRNSLLNQKVWNKKVQQPLIFKEPRLTLTITQEKRKEGRIHGIYYQVIALRFHHVETNWAYEGSYSNFLSWKVVYR